MLTRTSWNLRETKALLLSVAVCAGAWSQTEDALCASQDGDPLPMGAILRMGTARFKPQDMVACIVFSPDGKTLASAGGHAVHLWDVASGRKLFETTHLSDPVLSVAFWPK